MRLITTKIKNYKDFSTIVNMCFNKEHLSQEGLNQIVKISSGMNSGRNYTSS